MIVVLIVLGILHVSVLEIVGETFTIDLSGGNVPLIVGSAVAPFALIALAQLVICVAVVIIACVSCRRRNKPISEV
jgi:hypothetical protein